MSHSTGIDWESVVAELSSQEWEDVELGIQERQVFLGTVFALYPSGKYYTPWACSNLDPCEDCGGKGCDECGGIGSREAHEDETFRETLEAEAEERGLWIAGGEGDPCDIFAGERRDTPDEDEDDEDEDDEDTPSDPHDDPSAFNWDRFERVMQIAKERGLYIESAQGYAEPGYTDPDGAIVLSNWNDRTRYDRETGSFETEDDTPSRIGRILERMGCEIEWEDEWVSCECGKVFRTSPDSYLWTRSGYIGDGWVSCAECLEADPEALLKDLEGDPNKALTFDLDMESLGYVNLTWDEDGCVDSFQSGLYGGQCDDPHKIAADLDKRGIGRYVFQIDSAGQFETRFSVWVPREELGLADGAEWDEIHETIQRVLSDPIDSRGKDPATQLRKALQDAGAKMSPLGSSPGVQIATCDLESGTATVKTITPEDFVSGKAGSQ
jgi:hypothetical protein